jgi:hypothetical protein
VADRWDLGADPVRSAGTADAQSLITRDFSVDSTIARPINTLWAPCVIRNGGNSHPGPEPDDHARGRSCGGLTTTVAQQARNMLMDLDDAGHRVRF